MADARSPVVRSDTGVLYRLSSESGDSRCTALDPSTSLAGTSGKVVQFNSVTTPARWQAMAVCLINTVEGGGPPPSR
jgi:hypothetical protein